jgi:hypothetical protein
MSLRILGIGVSLTAVAAIVYVVLENRASSTAFQSISKGMSKNVVLSIMGTPSLDRTNCMNRSMWLENPVPAHNCVSEIQYNARVLPEFRTIGFDIKGQAVTKYHYVSP